VLPPLVPGAATAAFLALLAAAAWHDVHERRVPNGLAAGIALGALLAGPLACSPARGLGSALLGAAVGLLCWLPAWWRGALGAGDVKLFAAAGAWLGPALTWRAALLAALLGGVVAVAMAAGAAIAARRRPPQAAATRSGTLAPDLPTRSVPYAVPMAMALALAAAHPRALHLLP
jgi:prepilin peptidase CpaA